MELVIEYIADLVFGNERAALWIVIGAAAVWGCLFGVTGMLAVQSHFDKRPSEEDRS